MIKSLTRLNIRINGGFYIYLALLLLVIPLPWLTAWILAAVIHELGHVAVIMLSGHEILKMDIGWQGARIMTDPLGRSEWYCALAGPVAGIFLLLLIHIFPRLSICALIQSAYNLFPIYPLDGGRVLKGLLLFVLDEAKVDFIVRVVAALFLLMSILMAWNLADTAINLFFVLAAGMLMAKTVIINIPCKHRKKWVQ